MTRRYSEVEEEDEEIALDDHVPIVAPTMYCLFQTR